MKKLSETMGANTWMRSKMDEQAYQAAQRERFQPLTTSLPPKSPSTTPSMVQASQPLKIRDCVKSKTRLSKLLVMLFLGQKAYGTKPEDLAARDEYFELMLQDYTIRQVEEAFFLYAKTKDDFPSPANIIQLIENPPMVTYDDVPCSCLKHFGCGVHTAEKRAQVYAWYRDKYPSGFSRQMQEWLADYQREHGHQVPNI